MSDEPKPRSITLNLGTLTTIVVLLGGLITLYGVWSSGQRADLQSDIKLDSAAAQAQRAVNWIDANQWRLLHHKDSSERK